MSINTDTSSLGSGEFAVNRKRQREEEGSFEPSKRREIDPSCLVSQIQRLSALSEADFQKIDFVDKVLHDLFLKMQLGQIQISPEGKKEFKSTITIIKSRLAKHPLIDADREQACKQEIKNICSLLRGDHKKVKVSVELPQELVSLISPNESVVASLWQDHITITELGSMVFSEVLAKVLDDTVLEAILKYSSKNLLVKIKSISLIDYPLLGVRAPGLLLKYTQVPRSCFSCIEREPERFCDYSLQVGDLVIDVNKDLLSHYSPYFKALFESNMQYGEKEGRRVIKEADPKIVKKVLSALVGNFELAEIDDINIALNMLRYIDQLMCTETFLGDQIEQVLIRILSSLSLQDDHLPFLNDLAGELQDYFSQGKFLKLQEEIIDKCIRMIGSRSLSPLVPGESQCEKVFFLCRAAKQMKNLTQMKNFAEKIYKTEIDVLVSDDLFYETQLVIEKFIDPEDPLLIADDFKDLLEPQARRATSFFFNMYKATSNELFRQKALLLCRSKERAETFYYHYNLLQNGSSEEKIQAESLLVAKETDSLRMYDEKIMTRLDLLEQQGKSIPEIVAFIREELMKNPLFGEKNTADYALWYLLRQSPLSVEEIKYYLPKCRDYYPVTLYAKYLVGKEEGKGVEVSHSLIEGLKAFVKAVQNLSRLEPLDPFLRLAKHVLASFPEELKAKIGD